MRLFPKTVTELLCELISRPSVSPEGDSGGTVANEEEMAKYVAELLKEMGGDVSVQEVEPGRPNVVGRFSCGDPSAPVVAFVPHLDTVGVVGMSIAPFKPVCRDGRIYGRGASDTKGPMAAALWALGEWLKSPAAVESRVNWIFAATMGEEEMSTGASALCKAGFRADFTIALEPTDLRVVHASKGLLRIWAEAEGVACHASEPRKGLNAVYKMLPFLNACESQLSGEFGGQRHADLGEVTLNVGFVKGGGELNVVPDSCRVGLDLRTHPGFDNAQVLARLKEFAGGLKLSVHRDGPPFVLPSSHSWVASLANHGKGTAVAPWFSDANVFNAHGIPAVAFGPGKIDQAHTHDEFILESDLEEGVRVIGEFINCVSLRGY